MRVLSFPDEVAIGGLDTQAEHLALESERATLAAEALVRSLLRGDSHWRRPIPKGPAGGEKEPTWPSAAGW